MKKEENTLLEVQVVLKDMMSDIESSINSLYDKYTNSDNKINSLPPFESLRNDVIRYSCARNLTDCIDELNAMKLRVGILYRSMYKYQNYQPSSKTEYTVAVNFKDQIKKYISDLEDYRFELSDLIRNANNKLRVLDSVQFYDI